MIGEIINYRYEVLEKIGDGQIFSVYKTRDKVLNRLVALKVLSSDLTDNTEFAAAVRAGYDAVASLDHPSIARVLDADPASGGNFVACEFARGINVKERVQRGGTMQVSTVLDIMVPVLEALEYAHSNRMVHGDLRPQDIVVSPDGEVKVTDFGLASALRACPEMADRMSMRSVHYEAPEIAEGAAPSVSSDIYSAGVILYEMLTGTLPFDGPTAIAVALKQAKDIPMPPRNLNTGVPKSLSDLVMRAIEKSPAQRFPNVAAMLDDLRSIRDALRVGRPVSVEQPNYTVPAYAETRAEEPEGLLTRASYVWLIIAFVVVMGIVTAVTFHVSTKDAKVEVPSIMGMTLDEAKDAAREAGVTLEEDTSGIYSNDVEEGKIAQQFPAANTKMPRDRAVVKYWLSKGPSARKVPDLVGLPETEAYKAAEDAGFTIDRNVVTEYDEKAPVNQVTKQEPEKDTLAPLDSTIKLWVSLGPKPVDTSSDENVTEPDANARSFQVAVSVPSDADGDQEVKIVVDDSRGESTPFQEMRQPGDKVSETVTGYGSHVRIRVYVGGELVSDKPY